MSLLRLGRINKNEQSEVTDSNECEIETSPGKHTTHTRKPLAEREMKERKEINEKNSRSGVGKESGSLKQREEAN